MIVAGANVPDDVRIESADTQNELPFALCNEGYVLTRMFRDPSSKYYAVFERQPSADMNEVETLSN